jgi:sugar lactone lactonase YvrE
LLRVLLLVSIALIVLGVAYVIVNPGSGSPVAAEHTRPPVSAFVWNPPVSLGHGRATMSSGKAGLWVAQQTPGGTGGRLLRIDTSKLSSTQGRPVKTYRIPIAPQSIAVGDKSLWVVGETGRSQYATLLRVDPATGRVVHMVHLAAQSACSTAPFASCYPAVTRTGVWVPLINGLEHVNAAGTTADIDVMLHGRLWAMTAAGRWLWVLAETGVYRVDGRSGHWVRKELRRSIGPGMQANHITANRKTVWISSYPRSTETETSKITQVPVDGRQFRVRPSRLYPGAGPVVLLDGGLWLGRYDGQGEIDRLDAATGRLTGPFAVVPDQPIILVPRQNALWVLAYRSNGNLRTLTRITLAPSKS